MSDSGSRSAHHEYSFEAHGVYLTVAASDPEVLARIVALLPAGVRPCDPGKAERRFAVRTEDGSEWRYDSGSQSPEIVTDLTLAIALLDSDLSRYVASTAPGRIFVHAGAVAHRGRAIVIPGHSFSGKSTLVAALVRAGATYYSDEYAVLDDRGLVHPFARPLSIREPTSAGAAVNEQYPTDLEMPDMQTVESLGGTTGNQPVPVGLIAVTTYRPDASWSPERRSEGQGMLTLLSHTLPVRERPTEALAAARGAASAALVLEGERGEAEATARALLESAATASPNGAGPGA
jgi:hypothetical protein